MSLILVFGKSVWCEAFQNPEKVYRKPKRTLEKPTRREIKKKRWNEKQRRKGKPASNGLRPKGGLRRLSLAFKGFEIP